MRFLSHREAVGANGDLHSNKIHLRANKDVKSILSLNFFLVV